MEGFPAVWTGAIALLILLMSFFRRMLHRKKTLVFVVLGDIGRSPRMINHALAAATYFEKMNLPWDTLLIGYKGSSVPAAVSGHSKIRLYYLCDVAEGWALNYFPFAKVVTLTFRMVAISTQLIVALLRARPTVTIVQNPPAIPTLPVVYFFSRIMGSKFVIDWHNYGYTILELQKRGKAIEYIYKSLERLFGAAADCHLTVSRCLKSNLTRWCDVNPGMINILYDRPTAPFLTVPEREKCLPTFRKYVPVDSIRRNTVVLVTATSYTVDERLDVLLAALSLYDTKASGTDVLPPLFVAVTGKGANKKAFVEAAEQAALRKVTIKTFFLPFEEYPQFLGAADLGICLHASSSGLDLPMKLVDMVGVGLPALCMRYEALESEACSDSVIMFKTSEDLSEQLSRILRLESKTGSSDQGLVALKAHALETRRNTVSWNEEWTTSVIPLLRKIEVL